MHNAVRWTTSIGESLNNFPVCGLPSNTSTEKLRRFSKRNREEAMVSRYSNIDTEYILQVLVSFNHYTHASSLFFSGRRYLHSHPSISALVSNVVFVKHGC